MAYLVKSRSRNIELRDGTRPEDPMYFLRPGVKFLFLNLPVNSRLPGDRDIEIEIAPENCTIKNEAPIAGKARDFSPIPETKTEVQPKPEPPQNTYVREGTQPKKPKPYKGHAR